MRTNAARLLVACMLVVPVAEATAAPPRATCRLVVDPRGDDQQQLVAVPGQPMDPSLDIVSADVASDARNLTVAVRVVDLGLVEQEMATGKYYDLWFSVGEEQFGLSARFGPAGGRYQLMYAGPSPETGPVGSDTAHAIADISGVVDVAKDEVRMTAPLSAFAPYYRIRGGDQLYDLVAGTWSGLHVDPANSGAAGSVDVGFGGKSVYPVHAPSCLRVGS